MDRLNAAFRPSFDDVNLHDAPDLTTGDRAALDAIRRQLEDEYPAADATPPRSATPGLVPPGPPGHSRRGWTLPVVAAFVTLAAVGGGAAGAVVTVYMLRDPVPSTRAGTGAVSTSQPDAGTMVTAPALALPEQALADRVSRPGSPLRQPDAARAAPAPSVPPVETERIPASRPGGSAPEPVAAASPAARPEAAKETSRATGPDPSNGVSPTTTGERRNGTSTVAGPEPQGWSDPFRPLTAETAEHAGVAKAALSSSRASPVPAPAPPPPAPPLAAPGAATRPPVALHDAPSPPAVPTKERADSSRDESLLKAIREDWNSVKSGFTSAPEDFKQAWRSFTRDLKGLLDR